MESAPGPETVFDGRRYLYFGGTSYLGLAADPEVIEAGCAALRKYGVHSATSRSGCGTTPIVAEVEAMAARFFGTEAAFYFGSGYMSNHILVSALDFPPDALLLDDACHYCVAEASALAGAPTIRFKSGDVFDLTRKLAGHQRVVVMADAVAPVSGEMTSVSTYLEAIRGCGRATLILDDAHGVGVLGSRGRGLMDELGLWRRANGGVGVNGVEVMVGGTLSKALGGYGGIIPGTAEFVNRVRTASHYFDGASAPAAAVAGSSAKALELILREPERRHRLRENVRLFGKGVQGLVGQDFTDKLTPQFALPLGDGRRLQSIHETLRKRSILVPYLAKYSGVSSQGALRAAVFATHTRAQIEQVLQSLRECV